MPTKSKSEGRMRSRSRSRGRSRSRSRGRSKSPSRTKQTKTKQSPSPSRKPKPAKTPTTPTRSSTRIKDIAAKEVQKMEEDAQKQGDTIQKKDSKREKKPAKTTASKYLVGGPIFAFIMTFFLPAFTLGINLLCNKKSCSIDFKKLPTFPNKLSAYFDRDVALVLVGYYVFQYALACIPLGRVVKRPASKGGKSMNIRCNAFLCMFLSLMALAAAIFFKLPVTIVYDKLIQVITTSIVFGFVLSILAYIRTMRLKKYEKNEDGQTGCTTYDFFVGREMYPSLGPVDMKQFVMMHAACMSWGLLNAVYLWKAYTEGTLNPTLGLVAFFQGLYVVDALLFEDGWISTYTHRYMGVGQLMIVSAMTGPFLLNLQVRFLLEHSVKWHAGCLAGFLAIYFVGYIIYRGSNSEKNKFRQDPHNPMFANFKKIPSPTGQKLLASGWWGLCRHPNYLGDFIMNVAMVLPLGLQHGYLASIYPVMLLPILLGQAHADHLACEKKHGAAWDRYCREVKYRIIPYVY